MARIELVPSVLTSSARTAQRQISLFRAFSTQLHLDVMDGSFVSTRSFSASQLSRLNLPKSTSLHLMVNDVSLWMSKGVEAGIQGFILHRGSDFTLALLRPLHKKYHLRLALRPGARLQGLTKYAPYVSGFHVMTVEPGRQGAPFLPAQLKVLQRLRRQYARMRLSVDGHMNAETIPLAIRAGANEIILGSVLSRAKDPQAVYRSLQRIARSV